MWAPGEEVAKLTYFGLYSLQHRGQESAGIAVSDGSRILVFKDMGLVSQVFDETTLQSLQGYLAIGHNRYSTTGSSVWENAQPTFRATTHGAIALGHNGNLTNTAELARIAAERRALFGGSTKHAMTSDTGLMTELLASYPDRDLESAAMAVLPQLHGGFSLVFMDETTLYAARDPQGVRPLVLGRLNRGWVVASEQGALDTIGASFIREVEPGELIAVDQNGLRCQRFAKAEPKGCLFEYIYLARPDATIAGRNVHSARLEMGRILAREAPVEADLVIPTPEAGTPAAIGFAEESKIPYGQGFAKNAYVGRTFIQPSQTLRQLGVRLKLNPLRDVVNGKRLVVVDDTIVRGNTQRAVIKMLREAGAAEIHLRISAPPVKWPCFYGIDFPTRTELIANGLNTGEIAKSIGADSLAYISLDGVTQATKIAEERLCRACFDGVYPIAPPEDEQLGDNLLAISIDPPAHADALSRP